MNPISRKISTLEQRISSLNAQLSRLHNSDTVGAAITGGSNRSPALDRRLNREIKKTVTLSVQLKQAQDELVYWQSRLAGILSGERHPNGQRRRDAPSRIANAEMERIEAEVLRELVQVGDQVGIWANPHATLTVVRVNPKSITDELGEKWKYSEIRIRIDGQPIEVEVLRQWMGEHYARG